MGIIKWICSHFKCKSDCSMNEDINDDIINIDLTQYKLQPEDLKFLYKIHTKRPSINNYQLLSNI